MFKTNKSRGIAYIAWGTAVFVAVLFAPISAGTAVVLGAVSGWVIGHGLEVYQK